MKYRFMYKYCSDNITSKRVCVHVCVCVCVCVWGYYTSIHTYIHICPFTRLFFSATKMNVNFWPILFTAITHHCQFFILATYIIFARFELLSRFVSIGA